MRVVVIESDDGRRRHLSDALQSIGLTVVAVESVGEIERWPRGDIVVTHYARFTPWWKAVGATHVIVLVDDQAEGLDACQRGATLWLPHACNPDELIAAVRECERTPDRGCADPIAAPHPGITP